MHLHRRDVAQNLDALDHLHLQDVVHLDVQQNLDVAHLDVAHLDALRPLVVVVDAELRHQLRKDYFLDVVGVELPHLMRMDCCQDVVQQVHQKLELLEVLVHLELRCMQQLLMLPLALPHVMPSTLQDQHRVLLQVLLQVLD